MTETPRLKKLKKKLFVTAAYLCVATMLLVLVSYARYRMEMPDMDSMAPAARLSTNIILKPSIASHSEATLSYLIDLQPGDMAKTYALEPDQHWDDLPASHATPSTRSIADHSIEVFIYNGEDTSHKSQVDVDYTLRIRTSSRIPLEFFLPVASGSQTIELTSVYLGAGEYAFSADGEHEAQFRLSRDATRSNADRRVITVGWNNSEELYDPVERTTLSCKELTDTRYRKEVDLLEVRAQIISSEGQAYPYMDPEEVQRIIDEAGKREPRAGGE